MRKSQRPFERVFYQLSNEILERGLSILNKKILEVQSPKINFPLTIVTSANITQTHSVYSLERTRVKNLCVTWLKRSIISYLLLKIYHFFNNFFNITCLRKSQRPFERVFYQLSNEILERGLSISPKIILKVQSPKNIFPLTIALERYEKFYFKSSHTKRLKMQNFPYNPENFFWVKCVYRVFLRQNFFFLRSIASR